MQVIYFKEMLIPSDPLEHSICSDGPFTNISLSNVKSQSTANLPIVTSEPIRRNLEDFFKDWKRDQEERKKEANTIQTLCETLSQGLYTQSPHIVYKVIGEIRFEIVTDEVKSKLAQSLV